MRTRPTPGPSPEGEGEDDGLALGLMRRGLSLANWEVTLVGSRRHEGEGTDLPHPVIPAKAGIHLSARDSAVDGPYPWIPAFAGMTGAG